MKEYMKVKKEASMESATKSVMNTYMGIESRFSFLEQLDIDLESVEINFETILSRFSIYGVANEGFQLYTSNTDDEIKQMVAELLIAFVELYGDGKRKVSGKNLMYTWKNAVNRKTLQIEVRPEATGCMLVEKTVEVPAQPATTKTVYEVQCEKGITLNG